MVNRNYLPNIRPLYARSDGTTRTRRALPGDNPKVFGRSDLFDNRPTEGCENSVSRVLETHRDNGVCVLVLDDPSKEEIPVMADKLPDGIGNDSYLRVYRNSAQQVVQLERASEQEYKADSERRVKP